MSMVVRDPSRAPRARRELPEKKEPLSFLGEAVPSIFWKEREKEKINEQQGDNRILVPPTTHISFIAICVWPMELLAKI